MPYATAEQVRAVLSPDPSRPEGTPGELADDLLDDRVAMASAQADAALISRYAVPFTDEAVPRLVSDVTIAIA
jgi:hypothetical protein